MPDDEKHFSLKPHYSRQVVVALAFNPSTEEEEEAGGPLRDQGQTGLQRKFQPGLEKLSRKTKQQQQRTPHDS